MPVTPADLSLFVSDCLRLKQPSELLSCLQQRVASKAALKVMSLWRLPLNPESRESHDYVLNENIWLHHDMMRGTFWRALHDGVTKNGPSAHVRLALRDSQPIVLSEAWRRKEALRDGWSEGVLAQHGIRDGLLCKVDNWMLMYGSSKLITAMEAHQRCFLYFAATQTAFKMRALTEPRRLRKMPSLTPQEQTVLRKLSNGQSPEQIARNLNITESTVRTHVLRVRKKLNAKNTLHAVALSMRYRMMPAIMICCLAGMT